MKLRDKTEIKITDNEPSPEDGRKRLFQKLLDDAPLLGTEDKAIYREIVEIVVSEEQAQSLMELLTVKDIVEKRFEEWRYRRKMAGLIDTAGVRRLKSLTPIGEHNIVHNYLPHVAALSRIEASCAHSRRASEKDLRRMIRRRQKEKPPSIVPESGGPEELR
jgi:hypothetical protein